MTMADAAQATLDKIFYAQSVHIRDAPSGEVTESCSTCFALDDAVEAARIAAAEATPLLEKTAQRRRKTGRKRT